MAHVLASARSGFDGQLNLFLPPEHGVQRLRSNYAELLLIVANGIFTKA